MVVLGGRGLSFERGTPVSLETWCSGSMVLGVGCGVRGVGCEVWDIGYGVRGVGCGGEMSRYLL